MPQKNRKSKSGLRKKITLFFSFLIAILFFTNDFGLVDTEKSAIVTAVGVDYADGVYLATCQIMPPGSRDAPGSPVLAKSTGKTVGESFSNIPASSGWFPKLGFCRLILLGRGVPENGALSALQYFLEDEGFNDSALLAACKGKAEDFLSTTGEDQFVQILNKSSRRVNEVISVNLKDFAERNFSMSRASVLPLVAAREEREQGRSDEPQTSYDATQAILLKDGAAAGTLDARGTRAFNLLTEPRTRGYYTASDGSACYQIDRKRVKTKYAVQGGRIETDISVSVALSTVSGSGRPRRKNAAGTELSERERTAAEGAIREDLTELFRVSAATGCDFLGIGEYLYRYATRDWLTLLAEKPDAYLEGLVPRLSVTVSDA